MPSRWGWCGEGWGGWYLFLRERERERQRERETDRQTDRQTDDDEVDGDDDDDEDDDAVSHHYKDLNTIRLSKKHCP